jgi:hypothetical protein
MARSNHLPIRQDAISLAVLLEKAVRRFSRYHKFKIAPCVPPAQEPSVLAALRRVGHAYVVAAEDGYLKRGLKRRVLHEIGRPARAAHSQFVSPPLSGAFDAP